MDALQRLEKRIAKRKEKAGKITKVTPVVYTPKPQIVRVPDTVERSVMKKVEFVTLNFSGAQKLRPGDLVNHIRKCKIESIKHFADGSAEVELEIINKSWGVVGNFYF